MNKELQYEELKEKAVKQCDILSSPKRIPNFGWGFLRPNEPARLIIPAVKPCTSVQGYKAPKI